MTRLPVPGADNGQWGDILNTFLLTAHNADGSLKDSSVKATTLSAASGQNGQVLTKDTAQSGGLTWTTPTQSVSKSMLTGVILEQNGVYPARPSGFANVKFIGVNDPGGLAQDGDEWVKL